MRGYSISRNVRMYVRTYVHTKRIAYSCMASNGVRRNAVLPLQMHLQLAAAAHASYLVLCAIPYLHVAIIAQSFVIAQ